MRNFLRKSRPTASGEEEIGPNSSTKQRVIDATKIILEIAKESADACPPLKSFLGGISALMKLCEDSKDVEEKLGDLIPWLVKLKDNVPAASADADPEDAKRDEQLTRELEEIGRQSEALARKKVEARLIDYKQDSAKVVKLVEKLRKALLIYQFSQQQAMYNQIKMLTSSLQKISELNENAPGVATKIDSALTKLKRFSIEGGTIVDGSNSMQRTILFETLEGIKYELQLISERSSTIGYQETPEDVHAVRELGEGIKEAVLRYQLAQQEAIYKQNLQLLKSDEWKAIKDSRRAHGAEYKHGNRSGCLKGTRESVLDEIERWTEDFDKPPVYWLNGLAGTGKSTIAQTITERVFASGHLGASFFCSRDVADRRNLQLIFPTLAFQLAQKYPDFRSSLAPILDFNPDIVLDPLRAQMQSLVVDPLLSTGISTVIVVDALDECKGENPQSEFLHVLGELVPNIPGVKFFITSRPEKDIISGFNDPELQDLTSNFVLHMVDRKAVDSDIHLFFRHELSKLALQRRIMGWPTEEQLSSLCQRAAGFFVYAVATIKFLEHGLICPSSRLNIIMKSPESTAYEGGVKLKLYASLDSLYLSIFEEAFGGYSAEDHQMVHSVLCAVILAFNPLSPRMVSMLLGLKPSEVVATLESIQSLLVLDGDSNKPVQSFHKSFPDFIMDPTRCIDTRFSVSPDNHIELALHCIKLMNELPEKNGWSISDDPSEVRELKQEILKRHDSKTLAYAYKSWHQHLITTKHPTKQVVSALSNFFEWKFLFWIRVMKEDNKWDGQYGLEVLDVANGWLKEVSAGIDDQLTLSLGKIKNEIQKLRPESYFECLIFDGSLLSLTIFSGLVQEFQLAILAYQANYK